MKEFFQSMEKTLVANIIALSAAALNLFLAYAFVFGKFSFPEFHEVGLAWATLTVRTFMGLALFFFAWKWWKTPFKINWVFMKELVTMGGPIAISFFFEIMAFCSVTLFVGKLPAVQTAANNLALNIGSLAFMIPLSVSAAVGVKVGHAYGEKNKNALITYAQMSLLTSFIFTLLMGTIFYLFPHAIMSLYTDDISILDWAKKLLFWVACFQLFDGAQVTIAGILRGLSITRAASVSIFIGYWVIGIPLGYYLGFYTGLEAQGFWIGLATSLACVAIMMGTILKKKLKALDI
jgi:MATE family multidrug resistance protein